MKGLLFLILVAAGVSLFLRDRQQSTELDSLRDQNAQLTAQLQDKTATINGLQLRLQQQASTQSGANRVAPSSTSAQQVPWVPGGSALDRPAYRDGH